ncbi:hypothetical protein CRG96_12015 [Escherichia sp. E4930]|nr:hypothetical protein CRG96_12015 [Escherichia sp. E4930]
MIPVPYADMAQFYARPGTSHYSLCVDCQTDEHLNELVRNCTENAFPPCDAYRTDYDETAGRIRTGRPARGGSINYDWREARLRILWRIEYC